MAPSAQAHKRSHSLLLFQKLLNLRDSASPLTLVLDTLEQTASPLIEEFITRAKISHTKIIFISFATIRKPDHADVFVKGRAKPLEKLRAEVVSHCPAPTAPKSKDVPTSQKTLLIIDTLNPLCTTHPRFLTTFLSSLLTHPAISLVATYHTDIPLALDPGVHSEYEPHPLTVLNHLATAVLRVSNLYQDIERRKAQNRSLPDPVWGLNEGIDGVLIGLKGPHGANTNGVVVEMELRRRSGRAVVERFVLVGRSGGLTGAVSLLSDHPAFAAPEDAQGGKADGDDEDLAETTFNLGLTEKQRKDREGIVLPYFDAQEDVGGGEGGRILYDMGREDDFDEEEDEI